MLQISSGYVNDTLGVKLDEGRERLDCVATLNNLLTFTNDTFYAKLDWAERLLVKLR